MMDQLISHFHEFRKEFLAQCEIFRAQLQNAAENNVKNALEIASIQRDLDIMQRELTKLQDITTAKGERGGIKEVLLNPTIIIATLAALLIFLISDLNVKKENGLLEKTLKVIPGVKE